MILFSLTVASNKIRVSILTRFFTSGLLKVLLKIVTTLVARTRAVSKSSKVEFPHSCRTHGWSSPWWYYCISCAGPESESNWKNALLLTKFYLAEEGGYQWLVLLSLNFLKKTFLLLLVSPLYFCNWQFAELGTTPLISATWRCDPSVSN